MNRHIVPTVALLLLFCVGEAKAHGGGLDASGCHNDRKRGGYHCHRAVSVKAKEPLSLPVEAKPKLPPPPPPPPPPPLTVIGETKLDDVKVVVQSDKEPFWREGRWSVFSYPDEDSCEIGIVPREGEYLTLQHTPRDEGANLMITNKSATSIADGEKLTLNVVFMANNELKSQWENVVFTVRVMPDETRALVSERLSQTFLSDFSKEEFAAVLNSNLKLVGGVDLKGSKAAVQQLRNCALIAAELNPDDPFLADLAFCRAISNRAPSANQRFDCH